MTEALKIRKSVTIEKQTHGKPISANDTIWNEVLIKESIFEVNPADSEKLDDGKEEDIILTLKIKSFAFNHRDVWIRKGLYRNIKYGSTLGSDCVGTVIYPRNHSLFKKDVLVYPAVNWIEDARGGPDVPGKPFGILGGTYDTDGVGTFTDLISIRASHCVPSPSHLNHLNASAVPLAGLTAFRAVFNKGQVISSSNVLITGIGGGVAIWALQFCAAIGANVWVTSSSEEKIDRARRLGAKGGVNYGQEDWPKRLSDLLLSENSLDVVIDSGGGDIAQKCNKLLRPGGIIVNFGCTSGCPLSFTMSEVLRNLELRGCTMGSLLEFKEMVALIEKHKIEPVIYKTLHGFEQVDQGFQIMKAGEQFGKIVVVIDEEHQGKL